MNSKRQKSYKKSIAQKEKGDLMPLGKFFDQYFGKVGTQKRDILEKGYLEFEKKLLRNQSKLKQTA